MGIIEDRMKEMKQGKNIPGELHKPANVKDLMQAGMLSPAPTTASSQDFKSNPLQRADTPLPPPTKPIRTSANEVIFQSHRRTFNFNYGDPGSARHQKISFNDGYYLTDDVAKINFIKENFSAQCQIIEEGDLQTEVVQQGPN